jgi:sulfur dioxygenase
MNITPFLSSRGAISYLVTRQSGRAILIDPSFEMAEKIVIHLKQNNLILTNILETHTHADFFSSRKLFLELYPQVKIRKPFEEIDIEGLTVLSTPGHTDDSVCYILECCCKKNIFTGDTLLLGGTGRTDFQGGSSEKLYDSLAQILELPETTIIHPNHNYQGITSDTLCNQKQNNPRLKLVVENQKIDFVELMNNHKPPQPDLFEEAIEYNMNKFN